LPKLHKYSVTVKWTGNTGSGTSDYRSYERQHEISADGKKELILGSSDVAFRGDKTRWNPEELLVASLSACHKLWYLHLCAISDIIVVDYVDHAEGFMEESQDGSGRFKQVVLRPRVTLAPGSDVARADAIHKEAHSKCYIANSVNFPVLHEAETVIAKKNLD
jgi:organic hydroperoxide reductase OsmC/OhrA